MTPTFEGRKLREVRALTGDEVALLEKTRSRYSKGTGWIRVVIWTLPIWLCGVVSYSDAAVGAFLMLVGVFGIPFALLMARDRRRRVRLLGDAIQSGRAQVFGDEEDGVVLREPVTGLILNKLPETFLIGQTSDVADLPDTYTFSSELKLPQPVDIDSINQIPRRDLTREEAAELSTLIRRRDITGIWWRSLAGLYCCFGCVVSFLPGPEQRPLQGVLLGALSIFMIGGLIYLLRLQARLRQDLKRGIVFRIDTGDKRIEWLPVTRLLWTQDLQPAGFRTSGETTYV